MAQGQNWCCTGPRKETQQLDAHLGQAISPQRTVPRAPNGSEERYSPDQSRVIPDIDDGKGSGQIWGDKAEAQETEIRARPYVPGSPGTPDSALSKLPSPQTGFLAVLEFTGWPQTQTSACLCLLSSEIKGVCHHTF